MTEYSRARQRKGPLPTSTKFYQGLGALPDTFKNFAFNTFLLFYYNQVLEMPAATASIAIMLALIVDAITDPLMGSFSDNLQTRLGRRHPLMYASALPLALFLYLVFSPPDALGQTGLFVWLLVCAVGTRVSMTFFLVPWNALFAEFSDDYVERSGIVTYRYLCGWIGGVTFTWITWSYIFPSSAGFTPGHLNPQGYETFALVLAIAVGLAAFLTTHLTRREIPYLLQPHTSTPSFSFGQVGRDIKMALSNRDFLVLVIAVFGFAAVAGADGALEIYMQTYFWGLLPEDLRWFTIAILGSVAAFALVVPLQRRFDKKKMLIACLVFYLANGVLMVSLRFLDVLPTNASPLLLQILIANTILRVAVGTVAGIMFVSMIADVLDAQEFVTGKRQEGMFSAALSFATKATSGLGLMLGGFILQYFVEFPTGARPGTLDEGVITRLGLMAGIVLPMFFVVPLYLTSRYRLTREAHAEIQAALKLRRAEAAAN